MSKKWPPPPPDPQLRSAAEARLADVAPAAAPARSAEDLLHELQVHQIELEMQNEALRQSQAALEESRDRYVDLYEFAPVGYLTLTDTGMIAEANLTAAALLGLERGKLLKKRFSTLVAPEDRERFHSLYVSAMQRDDRQACELLLQRGDGSVFPAHLDCLRVAAPGAATLQRIALTDVSELKHAEGRIAAERKAAESLEEKVRKRTAQLRALAIALSLAEERERRALAQDLHDDLGQLLAVVKMKLTVLHDSRQSASLRATLKEVEELVDRSNKSVRSLALQLTPPNLHTLGLVPALEWLIEEMERVYGLAVRFHDDGAPKPLGETVRITLYRALRELLINVAKHAGTGDAEVDCIRAGDRITVNVTDSGHGFDYQQAMAAAPGAGGLGLLAVRERIGFIGGEMRVVSNPGDGTRITLVAPLPAPEGKS